MYIPISIYVYMYNDKNTEYVCYLYIYKLGFPDVEGRLLRKTFIATTPRVCGELLPHNPDIIAPKSGSGGGEVIYFTII